MQEIVKNINDKLKPSGWYSELRIFLESSDFSDIIAELKRKVEEDHQRFCPGLKSAFRFLEEVPYEKVKVVMLIDHACNVLEQADGVPLSTPEKYIDRTPIYLLHSVNDKEWRRDINTWLNQGILMIPLALTSRIEGRAHKKIWSPLIMRLIEAVNRKYPKIPWLLIGEDSWKYEEDILSPHIRRIQLKNPVDDREWPTWTNDVLNSQKKAVITW